MIANLLTLVFLVSQPVADTAEPVEAETAMPLNAAQQGALRCSAAFALVAEKQKQGDPAALEYPPLGERGREFFVRSGAQLMDQAGMTRETLAAHLRREVDAIRADGSLEQIMPPCLLLLDASGL
ncbi:hypothetical protein [Citromicrobium bathyomarinum]|uniref:hypothetical protein n=1 Tax=Citromicrobium bathyomarinum TaxID=72174 RepID=UPI00315A5B51